MRSGAGLDDLDRGEQRRQPEVHRGGEVVHGERPHVEPSEHVLESPAHVLDAVVALGPEGGVQMVGRQIARGAFGERREQVRCRRVGHDQRDVAQLVGAAVVGHDVPSAGRVHDVAAGEQEQRVDATLVHLVLQAGMPVAPHAGEVEIPCPLDHNGVTLRPVG